MVLDDAPDLLQPPLGLLTTVGGPCDDVDDDRLGERLRGVGNPRPASILGTVGLNRLDTVEECVVRTVRPFHIRSLGVAVQLCDQAVGLFRDGEDKVGPVGGLSEKLKILGAQV